MEVGPHHRAARLTLAAIAACLLALAFGSELDLWQQDAGLLPLQSGRARVSTAVYGALYSGIALSLLVLAARQHITPRVLRYTAAVVCLTIVLNSISILALTKPNGSDNAAAAPYAAELLLQGKNPYTDYTVSDALARFGVSKELVTRTQDGGAWEVYAYPAGSFLVLAPLLAAGLSDVRPLYILCAWLMLGLLFVRAQPQDRLWVAALALVHHLFSSGLLAAGLPEPLWGLAVLVSWYLRRRMWAAALLLGFAASVKQLGGFFIPFYMIYVLRTQGWRAALGALLLSGGVFLATNLPFLLLSPKDWAIGVLGLSVVPLPAHGVGPALVLRELAPGVPNTLFTALALGAMALGLMVVYRSARTRPGWAWVLPLPVLWFAWRSLSSYFYLVPLFAAATFLAPDEEEPTSSGADAPAGKLGDPVPLSEDRG